MQPTFWHGKRVFITGHTGFKGAWLSLWLTRLGAQVSGFALPAPTQPSLFALTNLEHRLHHIEGDIRDLAHLSAALQAAQPEIVLHLAAQSLVRPSYQFPVDTFATNVMGTVHILEAIRQTDSVKAAVMVTSDKCYDNKEQIWGYREQDSMGGHDPYSSSKGCAELVTQAYRNSFMHDEQAPAIASARAGNVIGGGDWATDRLIPDIMQSLMQQQTVTLRNPNAIRPWQHVLEPLSGYLLLAEQLYKEGNAFAQAWNFGPDDQDALSVEWVTKQLFMAWGTDMRYQVEPSSLHEATLLKLDCSKARTRLHWQPQWHAKTAIEQVCAWYKAYTAGQDMVAFTLAQIDQYQTQQQTSLDDMRLPAAANSDFTSFRGSQL